MLALALAAIAILPVQDAQGTVFGQVRNGRTGLPLRLAVVEVVTQGSNRIATEADDSGFYVLRNIPAGRRLIRATHIDHAPHEVHVIVSAGFRLAIDFDLELRPYLLPVITARANAMEPGRRDTMSVQPTDLGAAAVRAMEATPGVAELGLAEAAREVPGNEPVDPSDVLFVRGGAADLKLVLLDGAPVFAPFHIGGLIHALDTDMLRSATLYLGGAPARYDGGLAYVMDMETRSGRGNGTHANVAADLLSARGVAEGPILPGTTYVVGGRAVHGIGSEPFVGDPFPYAYGDVVGRIDVGLGGERTLSVTGFWNRETVRLDSLRSPDRTATWGNRATSLRYRGRMLGGAGVLTVAGGSFRTRLPIGGLRPLLTEGTSRRIRAAADFGRELGAGQLHFGGSFDRLEFDQFVWEQSSTEAALYGSGSGGNVAGMYMDAAVSPMPRVRLRGGLRADVYSLSPVVRVAPRVSATFVLTDNASVTLAAGRYRQYVQATEEPFAAIGAVPPEGQVRSLTVASASHFVLSVDQNLGEGIRLNVEGFYKSFDGLPTTADGTARASGVDLWVRRNEGRVRGWFGYSLVWVWSDDNDRLLPPQLFAGRQLLTAGLNGPLIGNGAFDVRVAYGAGLPFAAIPEPESATPVFGVALREPTNHAAAAEPLPALPAAPDQPYLRVDAQVARTWAAEWRGFAFELTPYVKVLNALNRRDGIFYYYDKGAGSQARALAGLPVLPIVGLDWKF
jgi:hypothetical protein